MKSPFKFLDPYERGDRNAFFGRETETKELYNLITKNRLIFLYGPSGTGKTSLVQCGLANCFERIDWMPVFIRRGDNINESLRASLATALGGDFPEADTIPAAIRELYDEYRRPVYLIFDQFEELFILGDTENEEAERLPFYNAIADVLAAELPCRMLFILREDYFGHLNQFEKTIPDLYHRKLRVEPMSRDNLYAVIEGSCRVHHIGIKEEEVNLVLDNITAGRAGLHMPYVQVYLHMLYTEAWKSQAPDKPDHEGAKLVFDAGIINAVGPITDVLGKFLKEQEETILKNLKSANYAPTEDVIRRVLDNFVSHDGTKVPISYKQQADGLITLQGKASARLARVAPALVSEILQQLEYCRVLRRSESDFELAHDTLAQIIDQQRSLDLRAEREMYNRIETGYREHLESGGVYFFDRGQLARLENYLPLLNLEKEWLDFIAKSKEEVNRKANAEREQIERELKLTEEKLSAERKAKTRQTRLTRLAAAVSVVALLTAGFGWWSYNRSEKAKQEAQQSLVKAYQSDLARYEIGIETAKRNKESFRQYKAGQDVIDLETNKIDSLTQLVKVLHQKIKTLK